LSSSCVYCQRPLLPDERQCPRCGRSQPPSRAAYQSIDETLDDTWEDEDSGWGTIGGPVEQRAFRRGAPLEPFYRQRRPSRQSSNLTRPPFRQNTLALKILIVVLSLAVVGLGGGAIAVALAHGGNTFSGKQGAAVIPTGQTATPASITPTATPTAITPTATPSRAKLCAAHSGSAITYQGAPSVPLVYNELLPDNLPLQPIPRDQVQVGEQVIRGDTIGLTVQINRPPAGQTITICKMTLKLVAFTPIADPGPNVLDYCDGVYLNPGGPEGGGCGGGYDTAGVATFTIASPQVGASMISAVKNDNNGPGQVTAANVEGGIIQALIHVTVPGVYTFSVGLWQDNTSGPTFNSQTVSQAVLVGHMNHYWGSQQCETPDMQALLPPPTNPPGRFICPGAPPQQ
jgi:hypothetical protein